MSVLKFIKKNIITIIFLVLPIVTITLLLSFGAPNDDGSRTFDGKYPTYTDQQKENAESVKDAVDKEAANLLSKIKFGGDVPAEIDGEIVPGIPTVEEIDSPTSIECPEGVECGQGWTVPINTPTAFKNATNGQCIDTDNFAGSQCWDLGNLYWQNYVGRSFSTCGKGGAKNTIEDGCWQKNAGKEFTMIWDKTKIQAGDFIVTNGGTYGHVCMALGGYNNGYVSCFGTNQGGAACKGGGAVASTINMGLTQFAGAFRPNIYISTPTPSPTPQPTPQPAPSAISYTVRKGDTLGEIITKMGWRNSQPLFGDSGQAQSIAERNGIKNRGLIFPGQVIRKAN